MGAAQIQLTGNVATVLKKSLDNPGHERVSFRVIANDRRFDASSNSWVDGDEFSVNVVCWGNLAIGVAQSVLIGDPVVVNGKILNRRYEVEGETRYATEVKAGSVSHDLTRGTATFRKVYNRPAAEPEVPAEPDPYEVRDSLADSDDLADPYRIDIEPGGDSSTSEADGAAEADAEREFATSSNGSAPF